MSTSLRLVRDPAAAEFCEMVGVHGSMLRLFDAIERAAPLDVSVVVEGQTGTGKELVARALHQLSGASGPLVDVNVAAPPESLADAELFGTVRGAFTGAVERRGLMEHADGGTLLLDEAGDIPHWLQAKLLRVLETRSVRRMGGQASRAVRFRLVLTVQQPATELVAAGRWRPDFAYRVAGVTVRVPPLAERLSDVPLLVNHFLRQLRRPPLSGGDAALVTASSWPGNVREVRRTVERAAAEAGAGPVTVDGILRCIDSAPARPALLPSAREDAARDAEIRLIELALRENEFDTVTASIRLGICRSHLYRRMRRLGMPLPRVLRLAAPSG